MAERATAQTRSSVSRTLSRGLAVHCAEFLLLMLLRRCREHGRKLKHAGDALSRASSGSSGRKNTLLAMAHHIDSILLYVFSFWCDDTANKNCNVQQWASVYGLVAFVKKQAQHENVPVVLGLWYVAALN